MDAGATYYGVGLAGIYSTGIPYQFSKVCDFRRQSISRSVGRSVSRSVVSSLLGPDLGYYSYRSGTVRHGFPLSVVSLSGLVPGCINAERVRSSPFGSNTDSIDDAETIVNPQCNSLHWGLNGYTSSGVVATPETAGECLPSVVSQART